MRLPKLGRDMRYKLEAKTAYGLLSTIIAIIEDDVRTMRMERWRGTPGCAAGEETAPACKTVGCIGGWINHLAHAPAGEFYGVTAKTAATLGFDIRGNAKTSNVIDEFFFGDLCGDENQGTPAHARKVIRLIKRFQRKHAVRLMATKVTPVARTAR